MATPAGPPPEGDTARRAARNMAGPFAAQLVGRALSIVYYSAQAKLLAQGELGQYIFASLVWLYANTITDWGLGTWLTREIAAHRHDPDGRRTTAQLFAEGLGVRLALAALALLPLLALTVPGPAYSFARISPDGATAIMLLGLSLLPGAFSSAVTALYNAHERLSLPAGIAVVTAAANAVLGVAAMLLGWGAPGLAGAALLTTCVTASIFYRLLRRDFFPPRVEWKPSATRQMLVAGFPLMLNGLLIVIFFRFDQPIIKHFWGDRQVAIYETAYKVINVTQIIPPSVVLALFPLMARAALEDRAALVRQYRLAVKLLLLIGLPLVVGTVALAEPVITAITLGKAGYLPYSAYALAILILYLPISFINGVTQYVLIALHRQSRITWAIGATALFNIGANWLLVPIWGIYAAALVTVLSEVVLLVPFLLWAARELGADAVRPGRSGVALALAGAVMCIVAAAAVGQGFSGFVALLAGWLSYLGCVVGLRAVGPVEWSMMRRAVGRKV
ncbi:MAG: flippase [Chloroflexia bacterium]